MIWLRVVALVVQCPGGPFGFWIIPERYRPLCPQALVIEDYDPGQRRRAEDRVRQLGAGARLEECRLGRDCRTLSDWRTVVQFKED
jgi:hypothetical protein